MNYLLVNQSKLHFVSTLSGLVASMVLYAGLTTCTPYWVVSNSKPLNERTEGTILLVGCIIIEPEKYMHQPLFIQFAYRPTGITKPSVKPVFARTDTQGYFILPNMPAGEYAISDVWQDSHPSIWFRSFPKDTLKPWDLISTDRMTIPMSSRPDQWPEIHAGGIINFGYVIFTIDLSIPSQELDDQDKRIKIFKRSFLEGDSFVSGRVYNRPSMPAYLLDKYPESEWAPYLRQLLEKHEGQ